MRDSSNVVLVFTDSINDIEIIDIKKKEKKNYKYEKDYNSVEEFNNRNKELGDYRYYIAYGSNMSLAQMSYRCRDSRYYGTGYLEGYRLEFRDKWSNIKRNKNCRVPVVIYKISKEDEKELDKYEKGYEKKCVEIVINNSKITGLIYVMKKTKLSRDKKEETKRIVKLPGKNYFDIIRNSYKFHKFNIEILIDSLIHSFNIYYNLGLTKDNRYKYDN